MSPAGATRSYLSGFGDAASLYSTGGKWDTVNGSNGVVGLTKAQASVIGGGDTVYLSGDLSDMASLYNTGGDWDSVQRLQGIGSPEQR